MSDPRGRADEASRDLDESSFTHILRRLFRSSRSVLAVTFVDTEGETIDYCSCFEPYETKIFGAQMAATTYEVMEATRRASFGVVSEYEVQGSLRGLIVRRVDDDLSIVVCTKPSLDDRARHEVAVAVEQCVDGLRLEAGLDMPDWEPRPKPMEVYVRPAVGWKYAPALFSRAEGEWSEVAAVLGRWEDEDEDDLMCFRVRTRDGNELTLAHDTKYDRWTLLTDDW